MIIIENLESIAIKETWRKCKCNILTLNYQCTMMYVCACVYSTDLWVFHLYYRLCEIKNNSLIFHILGDRAYLDT